MLDVSTRLCLALGCVGGEVPGVGMSTQQERVFLAKEIPLVVDTVDCCLKTPLSVPQTGLELGGR